MTAERMQRTYELFEQTLQRPPEERSAFLDEVCAEDVELRAEVESLLLHDSRLTDNFMRAPALGSTPPALAAANEPDALVGTRVGTFEIRQVIAAGGMGTVYEAVQEQPHRTVALKMIKQNVASRSALRRFHLEAQVLGRLRHPNIAQVYHAGVHDEGSVSRPYFAMEYIPDAKPITQYANMSKLDASARLQLFAKVCDAVHHGHQKGIIHRDLKPANILVDSAGEPRVIDFGVARATDSDLAITTQQTIIGQLVGTVQYMSPEQCDADPDDLDTRSDVYSLGVVLYELLTGVLPYDASNTTIYAATRAIKEQTPRRPSSINHRLRGDVETIALKALEKTRERRYQSAADVAHDIRRYLNREPITARPPTAWTRTVHWVARHPILTTTVACLGIAVFVAAGTYVSVRLVNARPYVIVHNAPFDHRRSEQGCETRLRALSGRDLRIWTREDGVRTARLRERPGEFGGGELLLLGFNNSQSSPFPGFLCAFDVHGGLENPVWKRRVETRDILRDLRSFRGATTDDFAVHYAAYVDVFPEDKFPEQPGEEVVVWFKRSWYSQTVLRIYDLRGELLYQVWHDGVVHSIYWMSDAGLLVLAGDCHWPYHDPFGTLLSKRVHDFVVFAVRPEPGFVADDYLDYLSLKPGDDRLDPPWYLRLRPDDALKIVEWTDFSPPRRPNDPGRSVAFYVGMHGERNSLVSWVIGDDGQEVAQSRVLSDAYRKNQRLDDDDSEKLILPDPDDFALVPFQLTDLAPGNAYGLSGKKRDRP